MLTDIDHLYDYYQWYVRSKGGKIFLFLHEWEYSLAGLLLAAALAHLSYVATDQGDNRLSPWGYFLTYRA